MILTGKQILKRNIITPSKERTRFNGLTYGAGVASYDIRIAETIMLRAGNTTLASSIEHFNMPKDLCAHVRDKSSWARVGVHSFNTHIDPGWRGYLTLELCYLPLLYVLDKEGSKWQNPKTHITIEQGTPIVQIVFEEINGEECYEGKYQDQPAEPVSVRYDA